MRLTAVPALPEKVLNHLACNLLHEKTPILTGRKKYNRKSKKYEWEIILKCSKCGGS